VSEFVYPLSDYDRPNVLLGTLGSLWSQTYMGYVDTGSHVRAKGQVENQWVIDLAETIQALSRYEVPIFKRDNWYAFSILQSEVNAGDFAVARYDGEINYDDNVSKYDEPQTQEGYGWDLPEDLVNIPLVMNRFLAPSMILHDGVDYVINNGAIVLNKDPFTDNRVAQRPVYKDGVVVDNEAVLWFWRGEWDFEYIYKQFGYVLRMQLQSSKGYRDFLNAIFDAIVGGTTRRQIENAMTALTGIPLVMEPTEVVEHVTSDANTRLVITDQHVYKFEFETTVLVEVGDTVHAGDALVDALEVIEFNRGEVPEDLAALAMGKGFLSSCYYSDLIFENRDVPLEVTEAADTDDGFTRVEFSLGGFPLDVRKFFDDMHERGVTASQQPYDPCNPCTLIRFPGDACEGTDDTSYCGATLAHLLDTRPATNRVGEPSAGNLPATINPLQFLIENVLRANAALVRVRAMGLSPSAVGISFAPFIRRIVPPHTVTIISIEMTVASDSVSVDQLGETISTFNCMEPLGDAVNQGMVTDTRMGIRVVSGFCQ